MFCFDISLPKKLKALPSSSKKAWHSFTSSLQPKLRHFGRHLKIPKSTTQRLLRRHNRRPFWLKTPRGGSRHSTYSNYYKQYRYQYQYQHLQQSGPNSPGTVYVDQLFGESSSTSSRAGTTGDVAAKDDSGGGGGGGMTWKEYISSLPKIRGVDERADEFITKFRQQMQIQRQQSIIDFHNMLARSA